MRRGRTSRKGSRGRVVVRVRVKGRRSERGCVEVALVYYDQKGRGVIGAPQAWRLITCSIHFVVPAMRTYAWHAMQMLAAVQAHHQAGQAPEGGTALACVPMIASSGGVLLVWSLPG